MIRGVNKDGSSIFYAWGRANMGALSRREDSTSLLNSGILPHLMTPIPGGNMWEVWCGSEYTISCSREGALWSTGWNEHGNLGIGKGSESPELYYYYWQPVSENNILPQCKVDTSESSDLNDDSIVKSSEFCYRNRLLRPLKLSAPWSGALACGGGHCVAISTPQVDDYCSPI